MVTAVALVLPVASHHLVQGRREGVLSDRQLRRCAWTALALVVVGLPAGLLLTDRSS